MKYQSKEYWASLIKMSLSRFFILHVLYKEQLHGYEITKRVSGITGGCCAPTEGSLYPVLKEFIDNGLVSVETQFVSGRERKVYTITEEGRQAYVVGAQAWTEVSAHILRAVEEDSQKCL
ncbi:MAG: PadR family transcriptional regulator [Sporomusaceae bacterium]|nr:PadR family transcriptional regulator [Sporomusaceae bacterium]